MRTENHGVLQNILYPKTPLEKICRPHNHIHNTFSVYVSRKTYHAKLYIYFLHHHYSSSPWRPDGSVNLGSSCDMVASLQVPVVPVLLWCPKIPRYTKSHRDVQNYGRHPWRPTMFSYVLSSSGLVLKLFSFISIQAVWSFQHSARPCWNAPGYSSSVQSKNTFLKLTTRSYMFLQSNALEKQHMARRNMCPYLNIDDSLYRSTFDSSLRPFSGHMCLKLNVYLVPIHWF